MEKCCVHRSTMANKRKRGRREKEAGRVASKVTLPCRVAFFFSSNFLFFISFHFWITFDISVAPGMQISPLIMKSRLYYGRCRLALYKLSVPDAHAGIFNSEVISTPRSDRRTATLPFFHAYLFIFLFFGVAF
ncbi:hypothetical protein J3F83DRAFT_729017 [Trichoderma novae-zelandiae]